METISKSSGNANANFYGRSPQLSGEENGGIGGSSTRLKTRRSQDGQCELD